VTRKETREGLFVGAKRLELPTLPSPYGDINVTRKETREGLFVGAKRLELPTSSM
jgi:hypothetical protein